MRDLGSRAVMCWGSSPHARTISGKHFRSKSLKAYGRKCLPDFLFPKFRVCYKRSKAPVSLKKVTESWAQKEQVEVHASGGSSMQTQEEPIQIIESDEKRRTLYNL